MTLQYDEYSTGAIFSTIEKKYEANLKTKEVCKGDYKNTII